ncbi:Hypothetical protein CINCED_3A001188 [Cinara cedri]|uniref:Uncharacterized protein n=1 Tax=Cinara cedri TaxID=506608 RepID=A0A5E4N3Q3_9HEMI|nr:Hypothetical protein CINCED_3A001188 [Cinara cedri]
MVQDRDRWGELALDAKALKELQWLNTIAYDATGLVSPEPRTSTCGKCGWVIPVGIRKDQNAEYSHVISTRRMR